MNERLNISDLAGLLAEYTGKDKKVAELFLRELLVVISDGLLVDKIVKVKGLGTFKVIVVEERESVHVNTGERFLIPAHSKLTFTPDKDLKELVNKPFSSFEAIELHEGVEFPEENEKESEEEEDADIEDTENSKQDESIIEESEIADEVKQESKSVTVSESTPEEEPDLSEELQLEDGALSNDESVANESKSSNEVFISNNENNSIEDSVTNEDNPSNEESVSNEEPILKGEPSSKPEPIGMTESKDVSVKEKSPEADRRINGSYIFLALFIIVFVIGGVYFIKTNYIQKPSIHANQESDSLGVSAALMNEDTLAMIVDADDGVDSVSVSPDTILSSLQSVEPELTKPSKQPIIEKIVPDTRLTLISLKHYGHKVFWVYIYEHNKAIVDNPNNIQLGTELVIPEPELYGIDAKNPESIAKAKEKQAEINAKFK